MARITFSQIYSDASGAPAAIESGRFVFAFDWLNGLNVKLAAYPRCLPSEYKIALHGAEKLYRAIIVPQLSPAWLAANAEMYSDFTPSVPRRNPPRRRNPADGGNAPAWYVAKDWRGKFSNHRTAAEAQKAAGKRGTVHESAAPVSFDGSPLTQPKRSTAKTPVTAPARFVPQEDPEDATLRNLAEQNVAAWWKRYQQEHILRNTADIYDLINTLVELMDQIQSDIGDSSVKPRDRKFASYEYPAFLKILAEVRAVNDQAKQTEAKAKAFVQDWFNKYRTAHGNVDTSSKHANFNYHINQFIDSHAKVGAENPDKLTRAYHRAVADAFIRLREQERSRAKARAEQESSARAQAYAERPKASSARGIVKVTDLLDRLVDKLNVWGRDKAVWQSEEVFTALNNATKSAGNAMYGSSPEAFSIFRSSIAGAFHKTVSGRTKVHYKFEVPAIQWAFDTATKFAMPRAEKAYKAPPPPRQPAPKPVHNYFAGLTDPAAIKRQYRELALRLHPDRGGNTREFQEMSAQYQALQPRVANPRGGRWRAEWDATHEKLKKRRHA